MPLLFCLFIASCYSPKVSRCKADYIEYICSLTRDGRYVHITINIKGKGKLLLESHDLYAGDYIHTNITSNSYTDTLFNILTKRYWQPTKSLGRFEKRFVNANIYRKISKSTPMEVYDMYFDKDGFPKNDNCFVLSV